ncbi:hypothetical protein HU200_001307 [Digitaria exilis]|uniref:TF-B3 domain-containing protein n=1 Tax=Digitaria exilis TaxID=1010633 RepID=A0A835KW41_9POAL|nr:hypothetical protein HU200_001307 [Digitaria exilis]
MRVEVGADGGGAFLGRGWPELAAACGQIPAKFVQKCITKEHLNNHMAFVSGPHGKMCQIELEINQLGVFFAGGWSQFMAFHGITADNSLLLRYEGNMVFTVKVFELNGCQREYKQKQIAIQQSQLHVKHLPLLSYDASTLTYIQNQQETPVTKKDWSNSDGNIRSKGSMTFLKEPKTKCVFEIGRPSWIRKEMNTFTIKNRLYLPLAFCEMIGLKNHSMIKLKTSMSSARFWRAHLCLYHNCGQLCGSGWKSFCHENEIKGGHICTFKIIEIDVWQVIIDR